MTGGAQLRLDAGGALPLDPVQMAEVPILERAKVYDALCLDFPQRQAVEEAVRLVIAKRYGRRR